MTTGYIKQVSYNKLWLLLSLVAGIYLTGKLKVNGEKENRLKTFICLISLTTFIMNR